MLALLPAAGFLLTLEALRLRARNGSWREAFLAASVLFGTATVLATEALSRFQLIVFPAIVCLWTAVTLGAGAFLRSSWKTPRVERRAAHEKVSGFSSVLLGSIALYVLTIAVVAFLSPPNTGDTFEYHMPKVLQWVQNKSVSFFPTAIPRQNHLAPGAEYAILHLQVLSGSDRYASFVEWMAMLGSLMAVSLIARQLGADVKGQVLSAVIALTLPMGIMQASSTQTDYVIAFWFTCFVHYLLRWRAADARRSLLLLALSASLALAVFTKATAYILAPAFLAWLATSVVQTSRREAWRSFALLAAVVIGINAGHYARNWELYRTPLGPGQEPEPNTRYSMEIHTPSALISNLFRHVATHLGTPWRGVNAAIADFYVRFHSGLGLDVNDTRTSWGTGAINRFGIRGLIYEDEIDGNPVQLLLVVASVAALLTFSRLRKDALLLKYVGATATGALLLVFYLKWHPWMSRLHLPFFVLAAPVVGVVLTRIWKGRLANAVAPALLLLGIPWLLFCRQRPMVGQENIFNMPRERMYLSTRRLRNLESSFLEGKAVLESRSPSQIGLLVGNSSKEYWWWPALLGTNPKIRFQHVNVEDASSVLYSRKPFCDFRPDAVLALDQRPAQPQIFVGGVVFFKEWEEGRAAVYFAAPQAESPHSDSM